MSDLTELQAKLNARFNTFTDPIPAPSMGVDVWLKEETPIALTIQLDDNGAYTTSVLRLGKALGGVDIFAQRENLVRLLVAIAQHLDAIDHALEGGPGAMADLFAESLRRERERSEVFEAPGHWQNEEPS